jgi:hypothetical protein
MTLTNRFQLPLLSAGQAQGSVVADTSFSLIDALMQIVVISRIIAIPPASPNNGDSYVVPAGATGAWSGQTNDIAIFQNGAWVFVPPFTGMQVYSVADSRTYVYTSGAWSASLSGLTTLPTPTVSTLGGVKSLAAAAHNFLTQIGTDGSVSQAQPAAGDISGLAASATTDATNASNISSGTLNSARLPSIPASLLPNPTASTLGGVESATAPSNQFMTGINTSGVPQFAQPSASNVSGLAASATTDTTNAANISSGFLPAARSGFWTVLQTGNALSNSSSAQNVFPSGQGTISLAGSTAYEFEAFYQVTRSAGTTSHTVGLLFSASQTLVGCNYLIQVANPTGNALSAVSDIVATSASSVTVTAANTSATENLHIRLRGIIITGTAPTLTPQIQYSTAPGGAPTVATGSFFRIAPLGSGSLTTVGAGWA